MFKYVARSHFSGGASGFLVVGESDKTRDFYVLFISYMFVLGSAIGFAGFTIFKS